MSNRRDFLGSMIGGSTGIALAATAAAAGPAPAPARVRGPNERVRFGLIGGGSRGKEILSAAIKCSDVEAVAVADVYTRRFDEVKAIVPGVATHKDYRSLLDDKSIDAVLIATPQHLHAIHFVDAIQAGKDVYQEKTMAFSPGHARRMRDALCDSGRVVQVGMQMNSGEGIQKARELAASETIGIPTLLQSHHFRNRPYGGWLRQIPVDCDTQHVDWNAFQGEAKAVPFDPQRFINWRFFWDYSGANVFENMVHILAFWYGALDLSIPQTVTMTGANYLSPKMSLPDTFQVSMSHSEKLLFTCTSTFGNNYYGEDHSYLFGTKATLIHTGSDQVQLIPQGKRADRPAPDHSGYKEMTGKHMQNFFDCVRSRKEPVCPFELGFRTSIACQMAIASFRRQATVRWDPATEEII
jgi:predicted dehydrogenase